MQSSRQRSRTSSSGQEDCDGQSPGSNLPEVPIVAVQQQRQRQGIRVGLKQAILAAVESGFDSELESGRGLPHSTTLRDSANRLEALPRKDAGSRQTLANPRVEVAPLHGLLIWVTRMFSRPTVREGSRL